MVPIRLITVLLCLTAFAVGYLPVGAQEEDTSSTRRQLEEKIAEVEEELEQLDGELGVVKAQSRTLEGAISQINGQIRRSELTISGLSLSIQKTEGQIRLRQVDIDETQNKIEKQKSSLAEFLRTLYKRSGQTTVEMMLAKDLSEFFREASVLEGLQQDTQVSLENLKLLKLEIEKEQENLRGEREELGGLRAIARVEQDNLAFQKKEKNSLLTQTKGQEAAYQQLIGQKQKDLVALRQQLNSLSRVGISAETALEAAQYASSKTGIRTAFLLGLLEVETGRRFAEGVITAGSNTGTGSWRVDMHPTRDVPVFLAIAQRLGRNPDALAVSRKPSYGWGGAMGPAQFIPSTWVLYEDRIAALTGHNPPDPWNIADAFTGAAIYLSDFGAAQQTRVAEDRSARAYISGRPSCTSSICNWYAYEVLRVAALIEQAI